MCCLRYHKDAAWRPFFFDLAGAFRCGAGLLAFYRRARPCQPYAVQVGKEGIVYGVEAIMHQYSVGEVFVRSLYRQIVYRLNPTF